MVASAYASPRQPMIARRAPSTQGNALTCSSRSTSRGTRRPGKKRTPSGSLASRRRAAALVRTGVPPDRDDRGGRVVSVDLRERRPGDHRALCDCLGIARSREQGEDDAPDNSVHVRPLRRRDADRVADGTVNLIERVGAEDDLVTRCAARGRRARSGRRAHSSRAKPKTVMPRPFTSPVPEHTSETPATAGSPAIAVDNPEHGPASRCKA